jgi:8-oxo-dGTP diphosphatase
MKGIAVVGAVIFQNGKILAAKRKLSKQLGGLWEFPGGKVEANESPSEALTREIKEELEAEIEILREIVTTKHHYDFATIELTTFQCELKENHLINKEHEEIKWLSVNELGTVEWAPADIPTIKWIRRNLVE